MCDDGMFGVLRPSGALACAADKGANFRIAVDTSVSMDSWSGQNTVLLVALMKLFVLSLSLFACEIVTSAV